MHDVLHDVDTRTCHGQIYTAVMDLFKLLLNCNPEPQQGPFIFFMILMRKWHEEEWFSSAT